VRASARNAGRASTRAVAKDAVGRKTKRTRKASRQELGRQVAQELSKLRPILKEAGTALLDRLDGELAGLTLSLDGRGVSGETPVLPRALALFAMLADVKALKVKPSKGRVKDLRRIEALLESLSARIPPGA
jgi:hypothetical protein